MGSSGNSVLQQRLSAAPQLVGPIRWQQTSFSRRFPLKMSAAIQRVDFRDLFEDLLFQSENYFRVPRKTHRQLTRWRRLWTALMRLRRKTCALNYIGPRPLA